MAKLEAKQTRETPYRNANNVLLLQGLFLETSANKATVCYTLRDHEYQGYPSLYERYMEIADPTEYLFARDSLDGWEHWKLLCEAPFFQPYLNRWREELELYIRAKALSKIMLSAGGSSREAFQANRYLVEKGYEKQTKGRPSKAEISKAARDMAENTKRLEEDLERIRAVNG